MTKFLLWVGLFSCFLAGAATAQAAGVYDVTTGGVTTRVACEIVIDEEGVEHHIVSYNGVVAPGATWNYSGNNVEIHDGGGYAILEGAKGAAQSDTGKVLDGNTGPPHQQSGTWERP